MAWQSHQMRAAQLRQHFKTDPNALLVAQAVRPAENNDEPQAKAHAEEMLKTIQRNEQRRQQMLAEKSSFAAYLSNRVSPLGDWTAPWPLVFWVFEVFLGSSAGTWLMARSLRPVSPAVRG